MSRFTLRDVLAQESLGLRIVTPTDDEMLDRIVLGAHGTEALHPVPWMQRDWALLITGVRLVNRPDRQRDYVDELADGGLAALGFGVGIDFESVPEAVVEAANARGFPVFEIPLRTPFREIIAFVNRSLLSADLHYMRRVTSMREFLLDALQQPEPAETVVQRVGSLLDGSAVLFSRDGRVEQAVGSIPPEELWPCVEAVGRREEIPAVRGRSPSVSAVRVGDLVQGWLVVAGRATPSSATFTPPLIETSLMVLAGLAGLRRLTRGVERAVRATFVTDLLANDRSVDDVWAHRAASLGFGTGGLPMRGIVVEPATTATPAPTLADDDLLTEVDVALGSTGGLSTILAARDGAVVGVVEAQTDELAGRLGELARRDLDVVIGVGRPVSTVADLRASLMDAESAAQGARRSGARNGGTQWFEDLDLLSWMVSDADSDALAIKAASILAPLRDGDVQIETLASYLEHHLNAVNAARVMNIHPNTLRYRLARIEERLGRSLQDPETISLLYVALRVSGHNT